MRSLFHKTIGFCLLGFAVVSCNDKEDPNYQYMPDMYESVGYETYGEYNVFENAQEAKLPVEGYIPNLSNPIPYTQDNLAEGKGLYTIYCAVCHGDKGDGKGILVEREKILGVPSYDDAGRAITEGSVYHVMYYGINNMGSYASQTSIEERWQIDHYVMSLKDKLEGKPEREFEEEQTSLLPSRADANIYEDAGDTAAEGTTEINQTETQE